MTIAVGGSAPAFELPDQYGATARLEALPGPSGLFLVFFPFAFSRTCSGELAELRDHRDRFAGDGVEVAAVSTDSRYALRAWDESERFGLRLLSDFWPHGAVARAYGAFDDARGYATRTTVAIGADGGIRSVFASPAGEPRPISAYLAALDGLRARDGYDGGASPGREGL